MEELLKRGRGIAKRALDESLTQGNPVGKGDKVIHRVVVLWQDLDNVPNSLMDYGFA